MQSSLSFRQQATSHWPLINRMAGRRFPQETLAEEAALFVMDRLAEEDWRRLRAFTGRSTLATYIGALTLRLLEDFSRVRFGRIKAPLWVRRLGGIWEDLFRLLCVERYTPAEAVALLTTQQSCAAAIAEKTAYQLLGEIPSCGAYRGEQSELSEDLPASADDEEAARPGHRLEQEERTQFFASIGRMLFDDAEPTLSPHHLERLLAAKISLEPRERLLLTLCFRDGVAVAEAGRMLGWTHNQVHGRLRRLLERLRQQFVEAGVEQELRLLL